MPTINTRSLLAQIRAELDETGIIPSVVNTAFGNVIIADYFKPDAIQTLQIMADLKR